MTRPRLQFGARIAALCALPLLLVVPLMSYALYRADRATGLERQRGVAEGYAAQVALLSSFDVLTEDVERLEETVEVLSDHAPHMVGIRFINASGDPILEWERGERAIQWSGAATPDHVVVSHLVLFDEEEVGAVDVAIDLVVISGQIARRQLGILEAALATMVAIVALSWYLGSRLSRSVTELMQNTAEVTKGNLEGMAREGTDEIGRLGRTFNVMTDRLKQTMTSLHEAREKAEANARARSEFLATMSHEIRTPLNAIIGLTSLLIESTPDDEQQEVLDTIRYSGEALLAIINDILDFSKIEAGGMTIESLDFRPLDTVEDAVEFFVKQAARKRLELVSSIDESVPEWVRGDPARLRQVLLNVLSNAVKFTEQGEVAVTVFAQPRKGVEMRLRIQVRDTGIGIEKSTQESLFQPFSQADGSTTRKYGGTGLGLTISKRLVELMGGEIHIESTPGEGTTLHISVALAPGHAPAGVATPHPRGQLRGCSILCVDDNETSRQSLIRLLTGWRVRAQGASGAAEALRCLAEAADRGEPFGLVLADQDMPGMNGTELARRVMGESRGPAPAFVLMVPGGRFDQTRHAETDEIRSVIRKPVRQEALRKCLTDILAPLPEPALQSHASSGDLPPAPTDPRHRILVVEDHEINRMVTQRILEKLGYEVCVASSGGEALEIFARDAYDLVFMDCQMPGMHGYEVARRMRQCEGATRRVPIIALTAGALSGERERCLEAGMDDFLPKPARMQDLAAAIDKWLV